MAAPRPTSPKPRPPSPRPLEGPLGKPKKARKPRPRSRETALVKSILETLSLMQGVKAWRNNTGAVKVPGGVQGPPAGHPLAGIVPAQRRKGRFIRYGHVGSADVHAVIGPKGRFLSIEAKSEDGTMSDPQKVWMAEVKREGGVAIMTKDVQTVVDTVRAIQAGKL